MRKIPTLFKRDPETRLVTQEITPGCEWVFEDSKNVIATIKYDGTACLIKNNRIYKRYDCKKGKKPPTGFIPAQEPDKITGHYPGWLECNPNNPEDKYHFEGLLKLYESEAQYNPFYTFLNGTYELIGEKIQGNPENIMGHQLILHGDERIPIGEISYNNLKEYLEITYIEGIVFYHFEVNTIYSTMCKIKKKDFGFKRGE
jgi:hypothetical protein